MDPEVEVPPTTTRRSEGARVQSVDRAVGLLRAIATASGPASTVAALAAECNLNRATAWRLLTTLEAQGLVDRDPHTGRYAIGFGMVELASAAGVDGLVSAVHPVLERVSAQTGETADLAIVGPRGLTYIDEVAPPRIVSAKWLGKTVALHATSTGKALLAWLPAAEAQSMLGATLQAYTDSTITDHSRLRAELERTRQRGYGVCRGELEASLFGVSAPVLGAYGRPLAILSIWGPRERVPEERFAALGEIVRGAADHVSRTRREA